MEAVETAQKEASGSEIKQAPIGVETAAPKEPSEIAKLRKQLGLPLEPQLSSENIQPKKRERVEEYKSAKEKDISLLQRGFLTRDQKSSTEWRQWYEKKNENLNWLEKTNRLLTMNFLRVSGFNNPDEVVSIFKYHYPDYSSFRDKTVMDNLKGLSNLGAAVGRLERLYYFFSLSDLKSEDFVSALKTLEAVPEEKFESIKEQLDKYFFLKKNLNVRDGQNDGQLSEDFQATIAVFKNGGLTQDQEEKLEQAYNFAILTGTVPVVDEKQQLVARRAELYSQDVTFEEVFNRQIDKDYAEQLLQIADNIIAEFGGLQPEFWEDLYKNINDLRQSGELDRLSELAKNGWDCTKIFSNGLAGSVLRLMPHSYNYLYQSFGEDYKERIKASISQAEDIAQNREKFAWIALFQELATGTTQLNINETNVYQQMHERRERLSELARIAKGANIPFKELLSIKDGSLEINTEPIAKFLCAKTKGFAGEGMFWWFVANAVVKGKDAGDGIYIPDELLPLFVYLWDRQRTFGKFIKDQRPLAPFIEDLLQNKIRVSISEKAKLVKLCDEPGKVSPELALANLDLFAIPQIPEIISSLPPRLLATLPPGDKILFSYLQLSRQPNDVQKFLVDKRAKGLVGSYIKNGQFDESHLVADFIREVRVQPGNISTYESLGSLFQYLQQQHPKGDELGLLYLKIAAAHRLRTIGERTEVERIVALKEAFAVLHHGNMAPFEKLSWEILRRQLPFAADQNSQENMRQQAVVVEQLNLEKLAWVHQSVHNYASVFEVDYLKSFKTFLETGEKTGFESFRNMFAGEARAPDYTEEDRQTFLSLNVIPELDKLIDFAGSFYGISSQSMQRLMSAEVFTPDVGKDDTLWKLLKELIENDLPGLDKNLSITSKEGKQHAVHFSFNVNKLRNRISRVLESVEGGEKSFITSTLVADGLLDDLSKNVFTKYKDYLEQNKDKLATKEVFESVVVLGNVITAAYYNGEVSEETFKKARTFLEFAYPESVTAQVFHIARLLFPVLRQEVDSYWEKFTDAGAPEMVEMLTRTGLSREEAEQRVYFTDLVDFKKTSMVFVLEPMMKVVEESLARIAADYKTRIPDVKEVYSRTTGEPAVSTDYANPEVMSFIENVSAKEIPSDIEAASRFLRELAQSPEAQAEKIARAVVSGYMDVNKLQTFQHTVIKNGKTIEFFPFSFYGVDMVVILENGTRVPNPKEFILQNFSVPKVIVNSLKEGD